MGERITVDFGSRLLLLNHRVSPSNQRLRHTNAERLGDLEILRDARSFV
jgi:hypothetical protein